MSSQSHLSIDEGKRPKAKELSLLTGPTDTTIWSITIGELLKQQATTYPSRQCVVFPETGQRSTYKQLYLRSLAVSKGLVASGVQPGQSIGILAGNCSAYVELFFAAAHIGATFVVFNCSYTASELKFALKHSGMWYK
jgi:mevalonyl-CoA ligase